MRKAKMSKRTKITKSKTKTSKSKSTNLMTSAEKMEKDFRNMPGQIATCYRSELMTVKTQEGKLKNELKKVQANVTNTEKKIAAIIKKNSKPNAKVTAASKKAIVAAKKIQVIANKSAKDLANKLTQIHKTLVALDGKQAKFTALGKLLGQLEKEISKKVVKTAKPVKQQAKATKSAKPVKAVKTKTRKSNKAKSSATHDTMNAEQDKSSMSAAVSSSDETVEMN